MSSGATWAQQLGHVGLVARQVESSWAGTEPVSPVLLADGLLTTGPRKVQNFTIFQCVALRPRAVHLLVVASISEHFHHTKLKLPVLAKPTPLLSLPLNRGSAVLLCVSEFD